MPVLAGTPARGVAAALTTRLLPLGRTPAQRRPPLNSAAAPAPATA